jgi:hypothetical protein
LKKAILLFVKGNHGIEEMNHGLEESYIEKNRIKQDPVKKRLFNKKYITTFNQSKIFSHGKAD